MMSNQPYILEETFDFAVVYKPPKTHSVPLKQKDESRTARNLSGGSLFEWFAARSPSVFDIMHRLDFETHGLVLFAKNKKSFEFFKALQESGEFVKEYSAVCDNSVPAASSVPAEGFPPPPALTGFQPSPDKPLVIESYFRPYGPGRKLVRPVTEEKKHYQIARDRGGFYRTEITGINGNILTVRIRRGFRHQIRCHLCWIGFPILNDPLYKSGSVPDQTLALCARALFFADPSTGKQREYRISINNEQ